MSKVRTFSRVFPAYHPKAGQPTYFVEKVIKSIDPDKKMNVYNRSDLPYIDEWHLEYCKPKHHTIRAGRHFKAGDKFSPRIWSGQPYKSKQIIFAHDIEVKKVWNMQFEISKGNLYGLIEGKLITPEAANKLAMNDGLTVEDMDHWFSKSKHMEQYQIICWNENVEY